MNTFNELEMACLNKLAVIGEESQAQQLKAEEAVWLQVESWDDESQIEEGATDEK